MLAPGDADQAQVPLGPVTKPDRNIARRRLLRFALRAAVLAVLLTYGAAYWMSGSTWVTDPTVVGGDASNYYAAGQRLNDGHPLYHLSPGDLEVPSTPPYAFTPLVSPPPIAVFWRLLAFLPRGSALWGWWITTMMATALTAYWTTGRGSIALIVATLVLSPDIVYTAFSGNVNALLLPATAAIWLGYRARRSAIVGGLLAVAVAVKVMPIVFVLWLLVGRRWRDLGWFKVAGAVIAIVSLIGAGLQAHFDWIGVVRSTNTDGISVLSLGGWLLGLGLPTQVAGLVLPMALLVGCTLIVVLRHRPGMAFSVAVVTAVAANPTIHAGSLIMLLPAVMPYAFPMAPSGETREESEMAPLPSVEQPARVRSRS